VELNINILEDELKRSKDLLELLTETSKTITSEVELEKVVQRITDKATELSGAQFGAFFYNAVGEDGKMMLYVLSGAPKDSFSKFPHPRATRIFRPTFEGLKTVRYDDVTKSPDYGHNPPFNGMPKGHLPVKSYLAVPVINPVQKEVIGGIFLGHPDAGRFGVKEEKLVEGIALQGAIAMGNAKLFGEKKKTEALLSEQTLAYKSILDSTFDAVIILNVKAEIIEVNQMACMMFKMNSDQLIGKHVKYILNSYNPLFLSVEKLKDETLNFQSQGTQAGGKILHFDCRARVFNYRNETNILLNLRDITEQVKTEIALKKSKNFSDTIADASPVVLWLTNEFGEISYINNLWYKWIKSGKNEDRDPNWINAIHEEDKTTAWTAFKNAFSKKSILDIDVRLRAGKEIRWVNIHAEPNHSAELFFTGMAGSIMDITIRKETQEKLYEKNKRAKEELENLVKDRTSELEKINYELLQFSSIASHDLKEPVRKISVFSRLLRDRLKENLTEENSKYLGKIIQSAERMMNLINDLLSFSRLSHVAESVFVKINLNDIINMVVHDLELAISEKKAQVNVGPLPEMYGIPVQLSQVFQNLISNSLKFSFPERQLVINISSEHINDNCFKLIYSDNGIGFKETFKEKIFDVFQRLHPKETYEGTGIGLSIVKKIVSLHKGNVTATGKEGEGAVFEITLPYRAMNANPVNQKL
jgi:PAS domain S-box-containing protein